MASFMDDHLLKQNYCWNLFDQNVSSSKAATKLWDPTMYFAKNCSICDAVPLLAADDMSEFMMTVPNVPSTVWSKAHAKIVNTIKTLKYKNW